MAVVIHINGWPGSGKLTIARLLAERIGARVLDNHVLLNPAEALFDRRDKRHGMLRAEVRRLVFRHAEGLDAGMPLILTDALADDAWDRSLFDEYRVLAAARGAELVPVVLECAQAENERRLVSDGRAAQLKLTRVSVLRHLRKHHRLMRPDDLAAIEIDVSFKTADEAARLIEGALDRRGIAAPDKRGHAV